MQEVHQSQGYGAEHAPGQWQDPRAQLHGNVEQFMGKVFGWMALAILVTAGVAGFISTSGPALELFYGYDPSTGMIMGSPMQWVLLFAPLGFVMFFGGRIPTMSSGAAKIWLMVYAALVGGMMSYAPMVYDVGSIGGVFVVTSAMFAVVSGFGYFTKKDLSGFGRFLMMAVTGIIIAWIASWFIPGLYFYVAVIGVLLFAGLAAYDTQRIKQHYMVNGGRGNLAVIGAMMLYASFMNMFIFLLHIFGGRD